MIVRAATRLWLLAGDLVLDPGELPHRYPLVARWCETAHVELLTAHDSASLPGASEPVDVSLASGFRSGST
jgi:hypothetical protein